MGPVGQRIQELVVMGQRPQGRSRDRWFKMLKEVGICLQDALALKIKNKGPQPQLMGRGKGKEHDYGYSYCSECGCPCEQLFQKS